MGDFGRKIDRFIEIFVEQRGYVRVLEGLQNTVMIAVVGLLVGVLIGTLIASVRVMPKYKLLPRVLNGFCSFYVGLFRGTPMVVQLLVCYYVLLPLLGAHMTGVQVSMLVFGLNSGAYISVPYALYHPLASPQKICEYPPLLHKHSLYMVHVQQEDQMSDLSSVSEDAVHLHLLSLLRFRLLDFL